MSSAKEEGKEKEVIMKREDLEAVLRTIKRLESLLGTSQRPS